MGAIFVDIDGTLTSEPNKPQGAPIASRVERVKEFVASGDEVILWSARGREYVEAFAAKNGIGNVTCVSKPDLVIDDNPTIRPAARMPIIDPAIAFGDGASQSPEWAKTRFWNSRVRRHATKV